ncbi:hypothetical protein LSTR_LSTR000305 [Laodelphax striatellus]|uniref:Uncharacterized protein n=1 Tax=Laodelphax striatellus TaxID=195883 RepID=A0A482X8D6_LAOST|nr:hypothetical protein LSTR_LSTR000305 [Laodelphax striatellus]
MPKKDFLNLSRDGRYKRLRKHIMSRNSTDNMPSNNHASNSNSRIPISDGKSEIHFTPEAPSSSNQRNCEAHEPTVHELLDNNPVSDSGETSHQPTPTSYQPPSIATPPNYQPSTSYQETSNQLHSTTCEGHRSLSGQIARLQMTLHDVCRRMDEFSKQMQHLRQPAGPIMELDDDSQYQYNNLPLSCMEEFETMDKELRDGGKNHLNSKIWAKTRTCIEQLGSRASSLFYCKIECANGLEY